MIKASSVVISHIGILVGSGEIGGNAKLSVGVELQLSSGFQYGVSNQLLLFQLSCFYLWCHLRFETKHVVFGFPYYNYLSAVICFIYPVDLLFDVSFWSSLYHSDMVKGEIDTVLHSAVVRIRRFACFVAARFLNFEILATDFLLRKSYIGEDASVVERHVQQISFMCLKCSVLITANLFLYFI